MVIILSQLSASDKKPELSLKVKYIFEENGKQGLLDEKGKVLVPAQFRAIMHLRDGLIPAVADDWFVLIKENGEIINKRFWNIAPFSDMFQTKIHPIAAAAEYETRKYGFIDKSGNYVVKPQFDKVQHFADDGLAPVKFKGKWGFIDYTGKMVIQPQFMDVWPFVRGLATVALSPNAVGLIDTAGKKITDFIYTKPIYAVSNVLCGERTTATDLIKKDGTVFYTCNGKGFLSDIGASRAVFNCTIKKEEDLELIDIEKASVIKTQDHFVEIGFFYNGYAPAKTIDRVKGYIDSNGVFFQKAFIEKQFNKSDNAIVMDEKSPFFLSEGYYAKNSNGLFALINEKGEMLSSPKYETIKKRDSFSEEDAFPFQVKCNGKWGFINEKGKEITPIQFDEVCAFNQGIAKVLKAGKAALIDTSGQVVFEIPQSYRYSYPDCTGLSCVSVRHVQYKHDSCDGGTEDFLNHGQWEGRFRWFENHVE